MKSAITANQSQQTNENQRNEEWLQAASHKCLPSIGKLHKLVGSKHANVRKELSTFSSELLRHCQQNMAPCVPLLLQINLGLSDEQQPLDLDDNALEIVENLFLEHLTKLPRVFYTGDEDDQLASTAEFYGFVSALSDRIRITLANESTLRSLVSALLCAVELELTSDLIGGDQTVYEIGEDVSETIASLQNNTPWKTYRNIRNAKLIASIEKICRLLGDSLTASAFVVDFLLNLLHSNASSCNEALILLQFMVKASDKCRSYCESIIDELLTEERWTLSTKAFEPARHDETALSRWFEDRTEGLYESAISMRISDIGHQAVEPCHETITLNDVKFNVLHMCLVIETLGLCSLKLNTQFQPFLLHSLRCLLEKSATKHYMIQMSAVLALNNLKTAFDLSSIADLIAGNADYITFSINSAMKCAERCPAALRILKVVLHYCSLDSMPHLETIIATVLDEAARTHQSRYNLSFIELFRMILLAIRRTRCEIAEQSPSAIDLSTTIKPDRNWVQMYNAIVCYDEESPEMEEEVNDNNDDEGSDPDRELPKPAFLEQTEKTMKRCVRNLASKNREEKVATFETLCIGLDIICRFEDVLLPMVHLIWEPFTQQCMRDKSPIVLRRCVCLLTKLAEYARDFIYKRFVE